MGEIDGIPILLLLGVYYRQTILQRSKILVYLYTEDKKINQFVIGYMINPTLRVTKLFKGKLKNS